MKSLYYPEISSSPITKRLRSLFVWIRGMRYHVMANLDLVKITWIIRQKERELTTMRLNERGVKIDAPKANNDVSKITIPTIT